MGPDSRSPQGVGDLFDMPGAGSTYSDPEFSWLEQIAPTAIAFPVGSQLGASYDDVALVADFVPGQIYALPLNLARDGLDVSGLPGLGDLVADDATERDLLLFGTGFNGVTDIEQGPDNAIYVLAYQDGAIYRIVLPEPAPSLQGAGLALTLALVAAGARALRRPRTA